MAEYDLVNKTDAEILADLQVISGNVTAFAWAPVTNVPRVNYATAPTDTEKSLVAAYFASSDCKKWVVV